MKDCLINIHAGDFKEGDGAGAFLSKTWYNKFPYFEFGIKKKLFKKEKIFAAEIEEVVIATEESVKSLGGTVGWGLVGGVILGPLGLLAGALVGGRSKTVTFICKFKDGRKIMGTVSQKTWVDIQAAAL